MIDGVSSVGIYADVIGPSATGTYTESLTLSGATALDSSGGQTNVNAGAGISMGWTTLNGGSNVIANANLTIGSGVTINSHAAYGGAVFLRSEYAGNLFVDNSGTIISLGVTNTNTAYSNDLVNSGAAGADGITATTLLGSVTVINRGSVTAYSGRGLYGDGNGHAVILSDCCTVIGLTGDPQQTVSLENTASGTVDAFLAGMRAVDYYGLATITNAGTVHSTARQALVAWSARGDASITNTGTATADDRNAIVTMTEIGNATILNNGTVVASKAPTGTLSGDIGYSGLRAVVDTLGNATITNTGTVTAHYDAAIVAHTPSGNATVTNTGTLTGLSGVFISSGASGSPIDSINDTNATASNTLSGIAKFVNTGSVTAVNYGAYLDGTTNVLANSGTITATSGTGVVTGPGGTTTINNSGTISGAIFGLDLGAATTLTNTGTISGGTAAVNFAFGGNTLNIYDSARFLGGVNFAATGSNTLNFYTGSYTLPVQNYLLTGAGNAINLLGSGKTLITNGLNGSGTGNIVIVDTAAVGTLGHVTGDVQRQVSGVITDIMNLNVDRPTSVLPSSSAPIAYGEEKPKANAASIVIKDSPDQALALDNAGNLFWMRGFYGARWQDANGSTVATHARQYGTLTGVDHLYEDWRLGAYGGVGHTATQVSSGTGSLDADMALAGLYARRNFANFLTLDAAVTGGHLWADTTRGINSGAETALGSFDGWFIAPEAAVSLKYALDPHWSLTPSLRATYVATLYNGYTEHGSSQNVSYDGHTTQSFEERFETHLTYQTATTANLPSSYWLGLGTSSTQRVGTAGYGATVSGTDFTVAALGSSVVYGGSVSTGFDIMLNRQTSLFGSLEGQMFSDHSRSAMGRLGMKVAF
ncbi:MAG: autotransporter domain-containing protein [Ancalomicrobiaceae bacterium]|nr:autotransporter domain-containing protein [Ancalomicrobiaceae bacterium]